jgi:hypothetical protein
MSRADERRHHATLKAGAKKRDVSAEYNHIWAKILLMSNRRIWRCLRMVVLYRSREE